MRHTLLLIGLFIACMASAQSTLLLDLTDPAKPVLKWPTTPPVQFAIETNTPHGLKSILIENKVDRTQLRFGGANEPIPTGRKVWPINAGAVSIGTAPNNQTVLVSTPDNLVVVVKASEGAIGNWPETPAPVGSTTFVSTSMGGTAGDFVPTLAKITASVATDARIGQPKQPDHRVLVDVGGHTWTYQELQPYPTSGLPTYKTITTKNRFHPVVGSDLQFRLINYDPDVNGIEIATDFTDLNLELQSRFEGFLTGTVPSSASSDVAVAHSDDTDPAVALDITAQAKAQAELFNRLRSDLQQLFSDLQTLDLADKINNRNGLLVVKREVAHRIMELLAFDPDGQDAFVIRAREIAVNAHLNSERAMTLLGAASSAAKYYSLIDKFGAFNRLPVHIENKDALNVAITFRDAGTHTQVDRSTFQLWNQGGLKIDFSAGLMWTKLIDQEFTSSYSRTVVQRDTSITGGDTTVTVTNVEKRRIARQDGSDFKIGAGLLAHAYWRTGWAVSPALSAGFMLNNSSVVNYLIGGSLAFGHDSRVILTIGTAFGKVKQLKTGYAIGGELDGGTTDVPTEDVWKNDLFFGLGFNFVHATSPAAPAGSTQ